jgi:hypothetical protein
LEGWYLQDFLTGDIRVGGFPRSGIDLGKITKPHKEAGPKV